MPEVELSAGPIAYEDTGGSGPLLVLVHGLVMDGQQWRAVVDALRGEFRCVLPTLPLGAHRRPMHPDADLTLRGLAHLVAEFLDALDLHDVTLCFNDWCGAQLMIADDRMERVGRLVLVSCEAFENYPPGVPGHLAALAGRLPGGVTIMRHTLLNRTLRRLPFTFGVMSKRGVADAQMIEWLRPLADPEIQRDYRKYVRSVRQSKRDLAGATDVLASFERPVLVVWASEDRMMPPEHGRRLAAIFPDARLVEIADSYTLVPIDQPLRLAAQLRDFVTSPT